MNKMNKKGFTLIEMLVVIAIIAVLVSIIIPTVANSTKKASAAADAANLRSIKAEITAAYLTGTKEKADDGSATIKTANATISISATGAVNGITISKDAPECKTNKANALKISYSTALDGFEVGFGEYSIKDFAEVAENGTDLPGEGQGSYVAGNIEGVAATE